MNKKPLGQSENHSFWNTQPVTRDDSSNGPIEIYDTTYLMTQQNSIPVPQEFEWITLDIADETQMRELHDFLAQHYVEDDDGLFRFNYSIDFLRWALTPPGYHNDWLVGLRTRGSWSGISPRQLIGFISGVPATLRIIDQVVSVAEINFLCLHKKFRSYGLAPALIAEVTRRVKLHGGQHAIYTVGKSLPAPIAKCHYHHRLINIQKLLDVGFTRLPLRCSVTAMKHLYRLPEQTQTIGLRPMVLGDAERICKLLNTHLSKYALAPVFDCATIKHLIVPKEGIVESWVVARDNRITDFFSFYYIPNSVTGNSKYSTLLVAYLFYMANTETSLRQLIHDALIIAKRNGVDVFNCLNIMDNATMLKDCKFTDGTGKLHYYLYNWKCRQFEPSDIGLVLV